MHQLPNSLFIGADKSGSTWLAKLLDSCPDVHVSPAKDTGFFSDERTYQRGMRWYARRFKPSAGDRAVMEVCHDYLHSEAAPARVAYHLGDDVRLVAFVRKPSSRALSAYLNARRHGLISHPLPVAVKLFPFLVTGSNYGTDVRRWLEHFDKDTLLVLPFDDLVADPVLTLAAVRAHIGSDENLPPLLSPHEAVRAAGEARSRLAAATLKRVATGLKGAGIVNAVGRIKGAGIVDRLLYKDVAYELSAADEQTLTEVDIRLRPQVQLLDQTLGLDLEKRWYSDA